MSRIELNAFGAVLPHVTFQLPGTGALLSDVPTAVIDIKAVEGGAASSSSSSSSSAPATLAKDVILVVDVSGSMSTAIDTVKKVITKIKESLLEQDRIAIVLFNQNARIFLPLSPSSSELKLDFKADGSTNIEDGLMKGIDLVVEGCNSASDLHSRLTLLMLLSDGEPNAGILSETGIVQAIQKRVSQFVNLPVIPQLVVHSFGFTTGHKPAILRGVTVAGNGGNGLYYFMNSLEDISVALGDCLGSVKNVSLYGLRLSATPLKADGEPLPGWVCFFYNGKELPSLTEAPTPLHSLGYLANNEQRNLIVVAQPLSSAKKAESFESPATILAQAYYCDATTREEHTTTFQAAILQGGSSNPELIAQALHVQTHVLRLRVSNALHEISQATSRTNMAPFEQLHELLLQTLTSVQEAANASPVDSMVELAPNEDEMILMSLEKDLGQALETFANSLSAKDKARLQQYAHEHANQRSASSATELRATYSTPEQAQMRAQFGTGAEQKFEAIAKEEKVKVLREEPDLTPEQKVKRKIVDEDVVCFVTLENWRAAHIGIGLLVQPLTMRERYKRLIPQIDFAQDYVSADAYNQGARSLATRGIGSRDQAGAQHNVITSSTRGRINAWLPLYINATNWKYVRNWAPSAFSIIATQVNDKFQPLHAIKVCARLLNSSVVKFMSGDVHLSDLALQQYADVHRLLLEMVAEHPIIQQTASKELDDFIQKPWVRGRELTPDIGNLIQYLTVSDTVSWANFKEAYIQESFRRNVRWIDSRFPDGHKKVGPDAPDAALIEYWSEGTSVSMKLMLFNVMFLDIVAHPAGKSMGDVKEAYDKCWGRLTEEMIDKLKIGSIEIGKITTLQEVMTRVSLPADEDSIAKLIRWAYSNEKEVPIPEELKKADNSAASQQLYNVYLQKRQTASLTIQASRTLGNEAEKRMEELNGFLLKLLPKGDTDKHLHAFVKLPVPTPAQWMNLNDLWGQTDCNALPPLLNFLFINKAQGKLIASPSGKILATRAEWYEVDPKFLLKEMVFSFGDTTVFVISNGTTNVNLSAVAASLKIQRTGSLAQPTKATASTGCVHSCISPFSTNIPAYSPANNLTNSTATATTTPQALDTVGLTIAHTVINKSIVDLGPDTEIYMSAGCENVQLCITVGELQRLVTNCTVFQC